MGDDDDEPDWSEVDDDHGSPMRLRLWKLATENPARREPVDLESEADGLEPLLVDLNEWV